SPCTTPGSVTGFSDAPTTHYPLLAGLIGLVMGDGVTLVLSADEIAKDVYRMLTERDLLRPDDASPPVHRPRHRRARAVRPPGLPLHRTRGRRDRQPPGGAEGRWRLGRPRGASGTAA